jgi:DNA-binding CsgD family transcriptional regulator
MLAGHGSSPVRAAAMFEAAASAWALLPRPYPALLARERRAGCLLAAGEPEQALAQLSQVAQGLAALGARRDADRVKRILRGLNVGVRPARRRGRPSYGRVLSPRERQVADFVADGRSNGQIAETLRLSPHTVRMHVKSAMRKLEAPSRGALSERAAQLRDAASDGHQHRGPDAGSLNTPAAGFFTPL